MHEWEKFEAILSARTLHDVRERTSRLLRAAGMDNFGYARLAGHQHAAYEQAHVAVYDYDGRVAAHYLALCDPAKAKEDPRVQHSLSNLPALQWNVRGEFGYAPPPGAEGIFSRGRRLIMNAGDDGTTAGITIPCWSAGTKWGFATFSTMATHDLREIRNLTPALHYLAHCMHGMLDRITRKRQDRPSLNQHEADALSWSAVGKTSWEISVLTGISERNVNYHLGNAARKLGVKGRRAAVARAITLGLITP